QMNVILEVTGYRIVVKGQFQTLAPVNAVDPPHDRIRYPASGGGSVDVGGIPVIVVAALAGPHRSIIQRPIARRREPRIDVVNIQPAADRPLVTGGATAEA